MRILYGYAQSATSEININQKQASVVKTIYDLYLQGKSLGEVMDALKAQDITSHTGNPVWIRAAIDKILSNGRYVPWNAQIERESRTNIDDKGRKTARNTSQSVLSGLLVCDDCGANYRRITRPSGEVVWRCADNVENGKKSKCSNSMTVSDEKIRKLLAGNLT